MKKLIITEKPSVAKKIAHVIGGPKPQKGYIEAGPYIITWAVGHLVGIASPDQHNKAWKSWRYETLPMIPDQFKLSINKRTAKQYRIVKGWLTDPEISEVIFATDAGAEGELIARWIYQKSGSKKPVKRLWTASLTKEALDDALNHLKPSEVYNGLYEAAEARAQADWIVGLNASRAVSLAMQETFTVGRVQTPTLNLVVKREREIQGFVSEPYYELVVVFEDHIHETRYVGTYYNFEQSSSRLDNREIAESIINQVKGQHTHDVTINTLLKKKIPPQLLSGDDLLQQATQKFKATLSDVQLAIQELYDNELISYPRTGDRFVTVDVALTFPKILSCLRPLYPDRIPQNIPDVTKNRNIVGDVSDHHAVIPTGKIGHGNKVQALLKGLPGQIYDLVCKNFIAVHYPASIYSIRVIITRVGQHNFVTKESVLIASGWEIVYGNKVTNHTLSKELALPVKVLKYELNENVSRPPSRYTEASLLKEMERKHLGTPATRANIINSIQRCGYVFLSDSKFHAADKGFKLIEHLKDSVLLTHQMTYDWEQRLLLIQQAKDNKENFINEIAGLVSEIVTENQKYINLKIPGEIIGNCPKCEGKIIVKFGENKKKYYGCNRYRSGCRFFISSEILNQQININDIKKLLTRGYTPTRNFTFKTGNKRARLKLNRDGTTTFIFPRDPLNRLINYIFN